MGHFRRFFFFLLAVCRLRSHHLGKYDHATEHETTLRPICSKFAVECKSRLLQNIRNFGLFCKKIDRFSKRKCFFFRNAWRYQFAVECVLSGVFFQKCCFLFIHEIFSARSHKIWRCEKLEDLVNNFFFREKHFHLFKSLLYENGRMQNMPLVADRTVHT